MTHIFKHHYKSLCFFIVSTLFFGILWALTAVEVQWLIILDQYLNSLIPTLHSTLLNPLFYFISEIFEPRIFIVWFSILLVLLAYKRKYFEAGFLFFGIAGGQVIKTIVKQLTDKARPENPFGIIDIASSFPSGHAVASVFIFLELYFFIIPLLKKSWQRPAQIIFILAMLAVPLSRLYLQVHYLSDVIAGALLAIASFTFTILVFSYFSTKKQ